MPEKINKFFKNTLETHNAETGVDVDREVMAENQIETEMENSELVAEQIENLRQKISKIGGKEQSPVVSEIIDSDAEKIKQYQNQHLPNYLKNGKGLFSRVLSDIWTRGTNFETEGKENIPKTGPFLVICNHFGSGDTQAILKTFQERNLHLAVGRSIWWDGSFISRWFLKQLKSIPVQESLANLSEQEKEEALLRQGWQGRKAFRKIIEQEKRGKLAVDTDFVRQAVAVLSRGETVGIFPEGLWLNPEGVVREKAEMKRGYRGLELIASQYKRLTGDDLLVVPTAFDENRETNNKKLIIAKPVRLIDNDSDLDNTDWCMGKVADMLPEEKRGYYKNIN